MIKTLRITSIVAAILAGVFFVFPVVYGVRSDENVDEFLKTPTVREKFENAADKAKTSESRVSPLVEQAEAFASYLNPPKTTARKTPTGSRPTGISSRVSVTPKFKVFATSYCPENPSFSQALIDEPGKGRHWIRQSGKVGHLLIEEVKDGLVIVKGSTETFELSIEQKQETTPTKPVSKGISSQSARRTTSPVSNRVSTGAMRITRTPTQPVRTAENSEKMEELVDKLKDLKNSTSDKTDSGLDDEERAERIRELISKFRSTRVGAEEAKKLDETDEDSEDTQDETNQSSSNIDEAEKQDSKSESK